MFIFLLLFSIISYTLLFQLVFFWKLHLNFKSKNELLTEKLNYKFNTLEIPFKLLVRWFIFINLTLYLIAASICDYTINIQFEHFKLANNTLWSYNLSIFINLCLFYLLLNLKKVNLINPTNFFFSLGLVTIVLPLLAFANTLYTFYFLLELGSLIIFYKLITSRCWYKTMFYTKQQFLTKFNASLPQQYVNTLFFQYWSSFFSSTLLLYVIINFLYLFSTSNLALLDFLATCSNYTTVYIYFLINLFILASLLKFGVTPIHLFKLEVYKGLSLIVILFYTIYILLFFVQYFFSIYIYYIPFLTSQTSLLLGLSIFLGTIYLAVTLFAYKNIKSFFALSTTINVLYFFWGLFLIL